MFRDTPPPCYAQITAPEANMQFGYHPDSNPPPAPARTDQKRMDTSAARPGAYLRSGSSILLELGRTSGSDLGER